MAVFAAMVESVDRGVGQVVEHLRSTGDLDNTLVLLLSDNGACYEWGPFGFDGESRSGRTTLHEGDALRNIGGPGSYLSYGSGWANLGNTPFRMYKHFTHEGGICTPLIAHWPGGLGRPGKWIRESAHIMDLLPTLLDAARVTYPTTFRGREIIPLEGTSLLPAMRRRAAAAAHPGLRPPRSPRTAGWRLEDRLVKTHASRSVLGTLQPGDGPLRNGQPRRPASRTRAPLSAQWTQWAARVGVVYVPPDSSSRDLSDSDR